MKLGILGLGSIGERHARNLRDLGHDVAHYDPAYGTNRRDEVIELADALVIASPTGQHYQDLLDCMATGKPTFVEKPIAATHAQWRDLQNFKSTKQVFVGNNLRFRSCVRKAKAWLSDLSTIGRPVWASFTLAQHNSKPDYLRDGVTLNWGAHECDLALHLLGPGVVRSAWISPQDDIADIAIEHQDNGCRTHIHLDYLTRDEIRRCVIIGTIGQIELDIRRNTAELRTATGDCASAYSHQTFDQDYIAEMQAFLDRIDGKETLGATGEDGLAALKICLDAKRMAGQA